MNLPTPCSVLGADGYIGAHLVRHLRQLCPMVHAVGRSGQLPSDPGIVFYAAGVTSDFRTRPLDAMEAHVGALLELVRFGNVMKLVYLSSTRVYARATATLETQALVANPTVADDLYNISKMAGESAALACGIPVVVARISNVFGRDNDSSNFLTEVVREAVRDGTVRVRSAAASCKDYVHIDDLVAALAILGLGDHTGVFNVAAGRNTSNASILEGVSKASGSSVTWDSTATPTIFPQIDVSRLASITSWNPRSVLDHIEALVKDAPQSWIKKP